MSAVSGTTGYSGATGATKLNAELAMAGMKLQKNAMEEEGENALKLLRSAALPQGQGRNLDVMA